MVRITNIREPARMLDETVAAFRLRAEDCAAVARAPARPGMPPAYPLAHA